LADDPAAELGRTLAAMMRGEQPDLEPQAAAQPAAPTGDIPTPAEAGPTSDEQSAGLMRILFAPKAANVELIRRLHGDGPALGTQPVDVLHHDPTTDPPGPDAA
jgi:hypothetical protein